MAINDQSVAIWLKVKCNQLVPFREYKIVLRSRSIVVQNQFTAI